MSGIKEQIMESLPWIDDQNWMSSSTMAFTGHAKTRLKRYDLEKPEKLHQFRTRFKQNSYVVEMIYQAKYDRRITKSTYNKMKNFGQELGNWHDYYQLMAKTSFIFNESRNVTSWKRRSNCEK